MHQDIQQFISILMSDNYDALTVVTKIIYFTYQGMFVCKKLIFLYQDM